MSSENKDRLALRMRPETKQKIEQWFEADNCRSRNEFIEKAVNYYADHLAANSSQSLPTSVLSAIDGRLGEFEKRSSSLSFRQAVELDIIAGILSDVYQLDEEDLRQRRAQSVKNVKQTNGRIVFRASAPESEADEWLV